MSSEAALYLSRTLPKRGTEPGSSPQVLKMLEPIQTESEEKQECTNSEASDIPAGIVDQTAEAADEQLMEQVCKGSRDALALLFRKHNRAVRNVADRKSVV